MSLKPILKLIGHNLRINVLKSNSVVSNFNSILRIFSTEIPKIKDKEKIKIVIVNQSEEELIAYGKEGDSILDTIKDNNLDIEGYGACDGTLACSTCHIILTSEDYNKLNPRSVEETDMLELSKEFTDYSRLGCQVILKKDMNGFKVKLPKTIIDVRQQ